MEKRAIITLVAGLFIAVPHAPAAELPGRIEAVEHHTALCHATDTAVDCDVSAVVKADGKLVFANDKGLPAIGDPAIFTFDFAGGTISGNPEVLKGSVLEKADKYEAMTTTLDGQYIIASTAFNKVGTEQDPSKDALNTLVYWPVNDPNTAKVLAQSTRGGIKSSIMLRKQIGEVIGSPYFQVEGITMAPSEPGREKDTDGQLIVGISKHGNSSATSNPAFLLISAHVKFNDARMELVDGFKSIQNFNLEAQGHPLALTGIEYDRFNKDRLYAVTSFETPSAEGEGNKGIETGGVLWAIPFTAGKPGTPQLVNRKDGSPLLFSNQPGGVEVLGAKQILVVHDDDRVEVKTSEAGIKRGKNEFAYSKITLP
ncbi:hypothetical protein [Pseudomonas sp. GD03746]|uniref:hypothetical protein n=1 Tax=Pseudomonas sp. GD03746 TaxID=2975378 RepID=UPI00244C1578|nr:hypothetical protein [Pseudomonas sp. GD03746]MDH1571699.1 hypothetical protein [Pseudomonas sp. GD03746]